MFQNNPALLVPVIFAAIAVPFFAALALEADSMRDLKSAYVKVIDWASDLLVQFLRSIWSLIPDSSPQVQNVPTQDEFVATVEQQYRAATKLSLTPVMLAVVRDCYTLGVEVPEFIVNWNPDRSGSEHATAMREWQVWHLSHMAVATCKACVVIHDNLPSELEEGQPFLTPVAPNAQSILGITRRLVLSITTELTDEYNLHWLHGYYNRYRVLIGESRGDMTTAPGMIQFDPDRSAVEVARLTLGKLPFCHVLPLLEGWVPFSFERSRFMHQWVVAPSGTGKTTLLKAQIAFDLEKVARGEQSIVVIDSQNVLIPQIARLAMFAEGQPLHNKLVLLEPDPDFPLSLNLFDLGEMGGTTREREMLEASAREMISFCLSDMTGQQSDLFEYVIQLLMAVPGATIDDLRKILSPRGLAEYRRYLGSVDGTVRAFFESMFDTSGFTASKEAVLRRVMGMLRNPTFRRMFQSKKNKFNMAKELDAGKVILINTDLEYLKADACGVFGRFFIAQLLQATETRGENALPVFCYIDECQDYIANFEPMERLLDKARKRNVGVILAHQRLSNIKNAGVLDALSNVAIRFAAGTSTDSTYLGKALKCDPEFIEWQPQGNFVGFVRGQTPNGVQVHVPGNVLDGFTTMSEEEEQRLRASMRAAYASPARADAKTYSDPDRGPVIDAEWEEVKEASPKDRRQTSQAPRRLPGPVYDPDEQDIGR